MADDQDALKWAAAAFKDSDLDERYVLHQDYYYGYHRDLLISAKYNQVFGTLFRGFGYNRCARVVDGIADRLKLERFTAEAEGASETAGDLWRRNRMDKRSGEVHKAVLRDGDAYLSVWPETGTAFGEDAAFPQFWPVSSRQVRVRYDEAQPGKIILAVKNWVDEISGRRFVNLYFPDRIAKYATRGKSTNLRTEALERHQPPTDDSWPVRNPWGTVPIFHFANNADTGNYGTSELHDIEPLQVGLNTELCNLMLASELTGYPVKVLLGFDHNDSTVMDAAARIESGRSKMLVVPPSPGGEKPSIDEFSAENLGQLLDAINGFDTWISRTSALPVHYLQMTGDFPSGRAMRAMEGPFVEKVMDRQTAFGNIWEDAMHLALRMAGVADPGMLTSVWKSAAPLSTEDKLDVALQQSAIGIPFEQIVRELGYDEEEIAAMVAEKEAAVERQMQMDVALTGIGNDNAQAQED